MLSKIISATVIGIDACLVEVETDISPQMPGFTTVGLPEAEVRESKDRVQAAIKNSGYTFPLKRVTVNLAPADIKKEGTAFDLPIALGILAATGQISREDFSDLIAIGELSLDGSLRPIRGVLAITSFLRGKGISGILVPEENAKEAAMADGPAVYPAKNLEEAVGFLEDGNTIEPFSVDLEQILDESADGLRDFKDVKGQELAKRALEVAAAGGHNIIMIGPPGSGKTMLARRLPTILPSMALQEALETTKIHSVAGILEPGKALVTGRPFRNPHHTISDAGLIGGGSHPKPGEVSLAHHGVLFLDELPEFHKTVLEVLRQPMEDRRVTISRASISITYPADFMLAAAMNPCPCGYFGDLRGNCTCSPGRITKYLSRISGPLLDRIDIQIDVPAVKFKELAAHPTGESSAEIRERVNAARGRQLERFAGMKDRFCNAQMSSSDLRKYCAISDESKMLLKHAITKLGFSARAYDRILKVARTIADLEDRSDIEPHHISEAIQYRSLDRNYWTR